MTRNKIELGALIIILACMVCFSVTDTALSAEKPDFEVIVGEWVRPDGGYVVHVRDVNPDGSVDAGYYNPSEIHIAKARVSLWKGLIKLFIELQDKGYPGSTYTLYYYAEKDALAGFYYQAAIQQTFKVVFFRKSTR